MLHKIFLCYIHINHMRTIQYTCPPTPTFILSLYTTYHSAYFNPCYLSLFPSLLEEDDFSNPQLFPFNRYLGLTKFLNFPPSKHYIYIYTVFFFLKTIFSFFRSRADILFTIIPLSWLKQIFLFFFFPTYFTSPFLYIPLSLLFPCLP